jgi:predicted phage tail protein
VDVTWVDASATETGHQVERSVNGGAWAVCALLGVDATRFVDVSVVAGSSYSYRVCALNNAGMSVASNVGTVSIPVPLPTAPTGLAGVAVSRRQIDLSWTDTSANETGFKVERSTNGTTWTQVGTVGANIRSYASTGLASNTSYYFRVRSYNGSGNSAYTSVVVVRTLR